jgi:hypothetical protein
MTANKYRLCSRDACHFATFIIAAHANAAVTQLAAAIPRGELKLPHTSSSIHFGDN